jgi:hypothetical protein
MLSVATVIKGGWEEGVNCLRIVKVKAVIRAVLFHAICPKFIFSRHFHSEVAVLNWKIM